jgi:hypothetical protein
MYLPDEMLEELSKHYREWNSVADDLFRRIKGEWEDRPCRGKLRMRAQWREFLHSSNHVRFAPDVEVNAAWISEGKSRLARASKAHGTRRGSGKLRSLSRSSTIFEESCKDWGAL